jgi:hypothetical protein
MNFTINKTTDAPRWFWVLETAAGAIAKSLEFFGSEAEARADVASFKKAAGGVRFAKVVSANAK